MKTQIALSVVCATAALLVLTPAQAQAPSPSSPIEALKMQTQIATLQQQVDALQMQVKSLQAQLRTSTSVSASGGRVYSLPSATVPNSQTPSSVPQPRSRNNSIPDCKIILLSQKPR